MALAATLRSLRNIASVVLVSMLALALVSSVSAGTLEPTSMRKLLQASPLAYTCGNSGDSSGYYPQGFGSDYTCPGGAACHGSYCFGNYWLSTRTNGNLRTAQMKNVVKNIDNYGLCGSGCSA